MSENRINNAVEFAELKGSLKRIEDVIMTIKEKNEEMAGDITKIRITGFSCGLPHVLYIQVHDHKGDFALDKSLGELPAGETIATDDYMITHGANDCSGIFGGGYFEQVRKPVQFAHSGGKLRTEGYGEGSQEHGKYRR